MAAYTFRLEVEHVCGIFQHKLYEIALAFLWCECLCIAAFGSHIYCLIVTDLWIRFHDFMNSPNSQQLQMPLTQGFLKKIIALAFGSLIYVAELVNVEFPDIDSAFVR
jgi:hypothetical protein